MFNKASFTRDYEVVKQGVVKQLQSEGVDPKGLDDQVKAITMATMVPVKAQWFKISSKNVQKFLEKYESTIEATMLFMKDYSFESLVKTYRKVNLDPLTNKVRTGHDKYEAFVLGLVEGSIKVIEPKKAKPKAKPAPKVSTNFSKFIQPEVVKPKKATKVAKKAKPKATKVAEPKNNKFLESAISNYDSSLGITRRVIEAKNGKGVWTEVFNDEYLRDRELVRVVTDEKQFFGRFMYIKSTKGSKKQFFKIMTKSARAINIPLTKVECVMTYEAV